MQSKTLRLHRPRFDVRWAECDVAKKLHQTTQKSADRLEKKEQADTVSRRNIGSCSAIIRSGLRLQVMASSVTVISKCFPTFGGWHPVPTRD